MNDILKQVASNTRELQSRYSQRKASIARQCGEEHACEAENGNAEFFITHDVDTVYISEYKFKLVIDGGINAGGGGGSSLPVEVGNMTYATLDDWLAAYPVGSYVDVDGQWGAQSLVAGSQILTAEGKYTNIENLKPGDKIYAADGTTINTVANNNSTIEDIYEVTTTSSIIRGTAGHRVFVNGEEKKLSELEVGDVIDSPTVNGVDLELSYDEYKFLGMWLGDGTIYKARNKYDEIIVTVGTDAKIKYMRALNLSMVERTHSNGRAKVFYLRTSEKKLYEVIGRYRDKVIPVLSNGAEEVLEGFLTADGTRRSERTIVVRCINKPLLAAMQNMATQLGYKTKLSKAQIRKRTNLCDHPKPIYGLSVTIPLANKPTGRVISVKETHEKQPVYHLNVWESNHSYICEGLAHHNCWDYVAALWLAQVARTPRTGPNHSAYEMWTVSRSYNAGSEFDLVTDKTQIKRGDVIVWGSSPSSPDGHVGIAKDNYSGNTIDVYGQNQGGTPVSSGGAAISIESWSLDNFIGAFRLKAWNSQ